MPSTQMQYGYDSLEHSSGVGVSSFATVLHFDAGQMVDKGSLFLVAIINSPDARIEKEIKEFVEQKYYAEDGLSPFESLNSTCQAMIQHFDQRQILVEISSIVLVDNVSYVFASNGSKILIIRDGTISPVLSSEDESSNSASGFVKDGDILLAATSNFLEAMGLDKLQHLLDEANDISELKEILVDELAGYTKPLSFNITKVNQQLIEVPDEALITAAPLSTKNSFRKTLAHGIDRLIRLIPDRKMMVRNEDERFGRPSRSKLPMMVGIGLLIALLVSIWFGVRARNVQEKKAEYQDELQSAQHQFDEARSLSGIDSQRAKELILSAKQTVDNLESRGIEDSELNVLGASIEQNLGGIAKIYNSPAETFLDLAIIRSDFAADDLAFSEGVIRVLDTKNIRMTLINAGTKKTENVGDLGLLPNALQATAYGDESYILSTDGIREVQDELSLVVKDEDWNSGGALIGAFGGNLYVLDKEHNIIWRYPRTASGFAEGQEWFAPGINVDVIDSISWAIDGKVWILSGSGEVDVYERGLPQRFVVEGVDSGSKLTQIFTDENTENVYLLDTTNSRIIALQKDGQYKGEYREEKLSRAVDFIVSEADSKIVFLSENKLWELPLQ